MDHLGNDRYSYERIAKAMFENYESIYEVDIDTSEYWIYHESGMYRGLDIIQTGEDFFGELGANVDKVVYEADREMVKDKLSKEKLLKRLSKERTISFVYRLINGDSFSYHQLKVTTVPAGSGRHFLIGVKNIDDVIRQGMRHQNEMDSMRQKEHNHLSAVLATSIAYIEADLTGDRILVCSLRDPKDRVMLSLTGKVPGSYSEFRRWLARKIVYPDCKGYLEASNREKLIADFERGDEKASMVFTVRNTAGEIKYCREIFYLYRDTVSGKIHAFCVVYDYTDEYTNEKRMKHLEEELRLSRIRNSTSQMQPHFLYNALGSIQEIVLEDPEYASELIGDFTVHLRSCIRSMNDDRLIPFSQEIENVKAYVSIEQMRLGNKLRVEYDIRSDGFDILPLTIQPLVENAIRHGIYQKAEAGGVVTVKSLEEKDMWIVQVTDNGVGFDFMNYLKEVEQGRRDSTGLKNIQFRLENVMNASIDIFSVPGAGTAVTVAIPKEETYDQRYSS